MNLPISWVCRWLAVLVCAWLLLSGCAVSPYDKATRERSDALLGRQLDVARTQLSEPGSHRIIFAGFALHSESPAFVGDVRLAEQAVHALDADAVIVTLANPAASDAIPWPFATRENIAASLRELAALARPEDKVVVLFSGHGRPGALPIHAGREDIGAVSTEDMAAWLEPFGHHQLLAVVSACFSGSFVPAIRGADRVVVTASARDRTSFGCGTASTHTFFGEQFWTQPAPGDTSLVQWMRVARTGVTALEKASQLTASQPQLNIGAAAGTWAGSPLSRWRDSP